MAYNTFTTMVQAARALQALHEGQASADSAGVLTVVDSLLPSLGWSRDDLFNGGTVFVIRDGAGAAPEGQSRVVTDYTGSSGTITVAQAFTAAVGTGDYYGVMTNRYPRSILLGKMNEALMEMGDVPTVDTSLTTVGDQLEYALPVAAKGDLREVWLARNTAAPYDWEPQLTTRTEWTAAGSAGALIFPRQPRVGYAIKLVYMATHPQVVPENSAALISEYVPLDWLALATAVKCAAWRLEGPGDDRQAMTALLNDLMTREATARRRRQRGMPTTHTRLPSY